MPEPFRSLASIFASGATTHAPEPQREAEPEPQPVVEIVPAQSDERVLDLLDGFARDVARLRARAAECLEQAAEAVLSDLATRVLGRELSAGPAALEAMLADALREFDSSDDVVVRVSGADAGRLAARYRLTIDPTLAPGDFALDTDEGRYDATLQTRLDAMLSSHRVAI